MVVGRGLCAARRSLLHSTWRWDSCSHLSCLPTRLSSLFFSLLLSSVQTTCARTGRRKTFSLSLSLSLSLSPSSSSSLFHKLFSFWIRYMKKLETNNKNKSWEISIFQIFSLLYVFFITQRDVFRFSWFSSVSRFFFQEKILIWRSSSSFN